MTYTLHEAFTAKRCRWCGGVTPPGGEYWKVKDLGRRAVVLCCECHVLFDCSTDGWITPYLRIPNRQS